MPDLDVLPTWFVLDAETIKADSLIRGDQTSPLGGDGPMLAIIERRTPEAGAFIIGRLQNVAMETGLISSYDDDLSLVLTRRQKVEAMTAGRLIVIAALHGVMPSEKNQIAAKNVLDGKGDNNAGLSRLGSALSSLESLEAQLRTLSSAKRGQFVNGAASIRVERADDDDARTEYGGCR